ncbi:CcdC protein domain-containing protein [uncultured Clostridium sp.]|jgi:4-amino-4-deoxy-L-arabinose transferase-like glycosyltransferase|uniref:CcdC protein domain-containing protein n=1 Tax=uncultured Clostridium sp. TaxID=59620 RepID=UPI002625D6C0|nr:CcdC protein domain-containing protein [uncultured Clostridium sp.]
MSHFLPFIIILLILIKNIKRYSSGTQKRVKARSFILLPVLILIYLYGIFHTSTHLPLYYYFVFIIAALLGGLIGYSRSKSYSFAINADGDVFYKKEIWDSIILIILLSLEGLIRYVFKIYDSSLFVLINTALIILATSSIAIRRVAMFLKYREIKKRL